MAYQQYCALARSLDLIGDRWTLLIVRELMSGATRYGEIRKGLPGVPSNLLVERLRRLEDDGLVRRVGAGYGLTSRGEALRPAIHELIRWGEPLMVDGRGDDAFSARWLIPALDALLVPGPSARVDLHVEGDTIHIVSSDDRITVGAGPAAGADVEVTAPPEIILGAAAGHVDLAELAVAGAIECVGDTEVLRSVFNPQ